MPRICLSYRRADSVDITGRIYDQLAARYGAGDVFMDVSGIPYGADYRDHIQSVFRDSKILLAVIGRNWLGDATGGAAKRIQESADPVHVEILMALGLKIHLVPVLVDSAIMPASTDLPADIESFSYRNAMRVDSGIDFHPHIERLFQHIDQVLGIAPLNQVAPTESSAPRTAPAPNSFSRLLPYVFVSAVLLWLAHYLIVMKLDTDPLYLRLAAAVVPFVCGFLLFQRERLGVWAAALLGFCVAVLAVAEMTTVVGLLDGHLLLPASIAEWQELFEYLATITLATVAGQAFGRLVSAKAPRATS